MTNDQLRMGSLRSPWTASPLTIGHWKLVISSGEFAIPVANYPAWPGSLDGITIASSVLGFRMRLR